MSRDLQLAYKSLKEITDNTIYQECFTGSYFERFDWVATFTFNVQAVLSLSYSPWCAGHMKSWAKMGHTV